MDMSTMSLMKHKDKIGADNASKMHKLWMHV